VSAFEAIAEPTRRRIVELLADGECSAGEIASHFSTSRPGISRHLRVLHEHGLVTTRTEGTRRLYSLDPAPLEEVDEWLEQYRRFWPNRLDALDTEIRRRRRKT
jgi:DNA-binding transcriptional ArsR family regulator